MIAGRRFLGYDEGRQSLGLFEPGRTGTGWSMSLAAHPLARDLQALDDGQVLVGFDRGFFELDLESGALLKTVDRWTGVTSVRRLPGGSTLVTGVNLDGGGGITVLTLDPSDRLQATARRPGGYVRLMRPTPEGTWLLGTDDHFLETDTKLREIRRLVAPGFRHAWMAHRHADGTTLVSGGYGSFMAHFDAAGQLARRFGGAGDVPEAVAPHFYAAFSLLPDGGVLVANWQGHGTDNGCKGRQLVEFGPDGTYRDSWSDPERISSLQGLLLV